ncbi:MAG: DciA family protein [Pseudomonadota bacterium]
MGTKNPQEGNSKRKRNARPVAELAAKVLAPVVARRTAMTIDLMTAWPDIAGEQHAGYTMPEKINWPRRASEDDPFSPGTLVIRCDGARAVLIQHETSQIVERVNLFFGFHAIEKVRLVQKPVSRLTVKTDQGLPEPDAASARRLDAILEGIDDPQLRASLEKLGRGVMARQRDK